MVLAGGAAGLVLGMASVRYVAALLFQVNPAGPALLVYPSITILAAALVAAAPAVVRAVRIDPANMLRTD